MSVRVVYLGVILCLATVGALAWTGAAAVADDLPAFQPPWRGAPGSTYQRWEFDNNDNPDPAEAFSEECPGELTWPTAISSPGADWGFQFTERSGIRLLDGFDNETITLDIDNCDVCNPCKEIWMQVTYFNGEFYQGQVDAEPLISVLVDGATVQDLSANQTMTVETADWGSWVVELYKFHIEPNPSHEQIVLCAASSELHCKFDQIVVDTICVPEPATLSLLATGCLVLPFFFRRRRSK